MNFDKCIIGGRLTRDPELRSTQSGVSVCRFAVAVNRRSKDRESVTFFECVSFNRQAEVISEHLAKGDPILIDGHHNLSEWEDKNGGGKRSRLEIIVDRFQFVGGRQDGDSGGQGGAPRGRRGEAQAVTDDSDFGEIPF